MGGVEMTKTNLRKLVFLWVCAGLLGVLPPSAGAEEITGDASDDREDIATPRGPDLLRTARDLRELPSHPIGLGIFFGAQVEVESSYESVGKEHTERTALDSVELAFYTEPWEAVQGHFLLSIEEQNWNYRYIVDEAFVRLGGTDEVAPYTEIGHLELPFAELDTSFIEGPLVEILGEIKQNAVTAGYENDWAGLAVSAYLGDDGTSNHQHEWVVTLKLDPFEDFELGTAWASNIGDSDELHELVRDYRSDLRAGADEDEEDEPVVPPKLRSVMGASCFAIMEFEKLTLYGEYIRALESYDANVLDDQRRTPEAWTTEVTYFPLSPWSVATRLDYSHEIPDTPEWQYGISSSIMLNDYLSLSSDYIHGTFADRGPDLDLFVLRAAFVY
jgi:hypothetical protein